MTEFTGQVKKAAERAGRIGAEQTKRVLFRLIPAVLLFTTPATASHGTLNCSSSQAFEPLFQLLHSLTELAFLGGVGLATLGFTTAGILIIVPGQEYNRRGKQVAKSVLVGTVLLLSANMIVQFIINQLGGVVC
ncbi:hypothetical protein [Haloplanus halobius]|uniref:hypothetical protein n=1 Tax=Haloplanus halobius TaxID=2934938 RepID=UPI00200D7250|nr:hypothetical protein [Haloplanus sp. XH21]